MAFRAVRCGGLGAKCLTFPGQEKEQCRARAGIGQCCVQGLLCTAGTPAKVGIVFVIC